MANLLATLTEPSSSNVVFVSKQINMFTAVISNIDVSIDVRIEYSFDKNNWYNLDNQDITIKSNGSYNFIINEDSTADFLRFTFVSETGGTNAQIKLYYNEK